MLRQAAGHCQHGLTRRAAGSIVSAPPAAGRGGKGLAMSATERFLNLLPAELRAGVRRDVPLRELTTLRVGGPAAVVCPVHNPGQALRFQSAAAAADVPWVVLGGGSNVLADDRGFTGAVLAVAGRDCETRGDVVTVAAGLPLDELVTRTLAAGLSGLEFASGIPGTVRGFELAQSKYGKLKWADTLAPARRTLTRTRAPALRTLAWKCVRRTPPPVPVVAYSRG